MSKIEVSKLENLYIAEYTSLKNEQSNRLLVRETVLYTSIIINAAIMSTQYSSSPSSFYYLLAIPFSALLLSLLYSSNEIKINHIRDYILKMLRPKIGQALNMSDASEIFQWENYHRERKSAFNIQKIGRLSLIFGSFSLVPVFALYAFINHGGIILDIKLYSLIWWLGCISVVFSTYFVFSTSDF